MQAQLLSFVQNVLDHADGTRSEFFSVLPRPDCSRPISRARVTNAYVVNPDEPPPLARPWLLPNVLLHPLDMHVEQKLVTATVVR